MEVPTIFFQAYIRPMSGDIPRKYGLKYGTVPYIELLFLWFMSQLITGHHPVHSLDMAWFVRLLLGLIQNGYQISSLIDSSALLILN